MTVQFDTQMLIGSSFEAGTEGEETAAEPANQRLRPCMPQPVGQGMLCGPHSNDMLAR